MRGIGIVRVGVVVLITLALAACGGGGTPASPPSSNAVPVASATAPSMVSERGQVELDGSDSDDPDGDTLSYDWTQTAGPVVTLSNVSAISPTFTAPPVSQDTLLTFELAVTDSGGLTASDEVSVVVEDVGLGTGPVNCVDGLADEFACSGISLARWIALEELGGSFGNDSWGWVDPLDQREYALMGLDNGVSIVDITMPQAPVWMGRVPTNTISSIWRDIKVFNNHVFIVADNAGLHGMQVFDLTRVRGVTGTPTFAADVVYADFGSAHNIAINEATGFAYVVGSDTCFGGLHMIDINEPFNPSFAGCHGTDGYTHDVVCVDYAGPDTDHTGKEICIASNEDKVVIVDTTDKNNTVTLASINYPDVGFVHQAWLTEDHRFLLVDDELDELNLGVNTRTHVIDVTSLDAPQYLYAHEHASSAIDHNLYVLGDRVFEANYSAGLRVLSFGDLATDTFAEVAFFDTYPDSNAAEFVGAWNVYPFFPSGTVIVSDSDRGLFVLTLDE